MCRIISIFSWTLNILLCYFYELVFKQANLVMRFLPRWAVKLCSIPFISRVLVTSICYTVGSLKQPHRGTLRSIRHQFSEESCCSTGTDHMAHPALKAVTAALAVGESCLTRGRPQLQAAYPHRQGRPQRRRVQRRTGVCKRMRAHESNAWRACH